MDEQGRTVSTPIRTRGNSVRVRALHIAYPPPVGRPPFALLDAGVSRIGRLPDVAGPLGFHDREISRAHASAHHDKGGEVRLVDGGSRNGTFVNGRRIDEATLVHGDVIRVGGVLLVYSDVDLDRSAPLGPPAPPLLGASLAMQLVRGRIGLIAPRPIPVLVLGETGAGKELVAQELHRLSGRTGAYVTLNCAGLSATLADAELFGYRKGAFTGADRDRAGLFSAAHAGTLLLDEVGELDLVVQAKLLRALENAEIRPVGATEVERVDVRVIAATNRNLADAVAEGTFREDLLARLGAFVMRVPPLRERREDILPLAAAFLGRELPDATLSTAAAEQILIHGWPTNVRGLKTAIQGAAVLAAGGGTILPEHLPAELAPRSDTLDMRPTPLAELPIDVRVPRHLTPTREELLQVLAHFDGNVSHAAEYFGKDRKQLRRWAERHDIDMAAFRGEAD